MTRMALCTWGIPADRPRRPSNESRPSGFCASRKCSRRLHARHRPRQTSFLNRANVTATRPMERERDQDITLREERTTESVPREQLRRASEERRLLILSRRRLIRRGYHSPRVARAPGFSRGISSKSSSCGARACKVDSIKISIAFPDQCVCESVCNGKRATPGSDGSPVEY
jgi:hypothetical protein